jgi:heme-degrading monooxygenase HmoA
MSVADLGRPSFTSGNWMVTEGNEEAFVEAWNLVAAWCLEHARGARSFHLIRDVANLRHFVSFGEWDELGDITVSRASPEFLRLFRKAQSLCDTFSGSDYEVALAAVAGE